MNYRTGAAPPMKIAWRAVVPAVVSDAVASLIALWIAYTFRFDFHLIRIPGGEIPSPARYEAAAPVAALVVIAVFFFMDVYRVPRGEQFIDEVFSVLKAMAVVLVVVFALIGVYKDGQFTYSRLTFFFWSIVATVLLLVARYVRRRLRMRRWQRGQGVDRVVVVGSGAAADLVLQRIRMFPDYGYQVVGLVSNGSTASPAGTAPGILGTRNELRRIVDEQKVNLVFVAESDLSQDQILELVDSCRDSGVDFRIVPSMLEIMTSRVTADQLDGIPLLQFRHGLDVDAAKATSKRVLDILVAGIGMVVISPILLLIAILVKVTSPGPVLLHQERVGLNEKPMMMHKFRTMSANAEAETGPVWASTDDPRRTVVGRFLRRFSLDELPQLWNVYVGEMSLVGPRPERPQFVKEFNERVPRYADRHLVRPGLTGWAQVNDLRGRTSIEERLIYDLYYIENWSLAFDFKIVLVTLASVIGSKHAY